MAGLKRQSEGGPARGTKRPLPTDPTSSTPTDKPAASQPRPVFTSALLADEGDFPRGGGTTLTPLEYKEVRDEGRKEAEKDVEAERKKRRLNQNQNKRGKNNGRSGAGDEKKEARDKDAIRVEHLSYKRLTPSTKILARVHSVLNLHLILSLPNQLLAHVPITEVTDSLTHLLTKDEKDSEDGMSDIQAEGENEESDEEEDKDVPELHQLFTPGQYVLTTLTQSYPSESSNRAFLTLYPPSEVIRLASRLEMSLVPGKVNKDVSKLDVVKGYRVTGEVRAEEDHGWIVGLGVEGIEGFLRKEDVKGANIVVGQLLDTVVSEVQSNGRIARLTIDPVIVARTQQQEVTTITSLLPGHIVSALITSIIPSTGLNLKIFGTFDSTVDLTHLPVPASADLEEKYKVGKKVKARIIFETVGTTDSGKVFGLSLLPHVIDGKSPMVDGVDVEGKMTIGTICEDVEVERVEKEWGLACVTREGYRAWVHMSHVADERPASLSGTGPYRVGTKHKARVLGHSPFDGLVLLSFEPKVINQKFMLVSEVKVGEMMKGTISNLTDKALFVDVSGSVQGIVYPLHYADIKLKHPEKRFKAGQSVKCRVFSVEPEKGRVKLTLKKSLVEATETVPLGFEDVKVDMVTPGLITKVFEKGCLVELFSGIVAYVPLAEVSDAYITDLKTAVFEGKPVKVKITSVDRESQKMFASIRQALPSNLAAAAIEIDDVVSGEVAQIHQDQIVLKLLPSQRKAILALGNLAHHRGVKIAALKAELKVGEKLDDLVVVVKSDETGLIIVANKQKAVTTDASTGLISKGMNMSNLKPGQVVPARVTKKNAQGYFLSITRNVVGRLHPTDMADDFGKLPEINQGDIVKCCVVKVDAESRQLDLSTRPSRVDAASSSGKSVIVDREVESLSDLKKDQKIRGIVKNITGSGLYVSLGRNITARVMIKEMFDDYVAEWQSRFEKGQVVQGKLLSIDVKKEQVEMTLKKKASKTKDKKSTAGLADFEVDQKVDAIVRKVEDYGIFLKIDGTNVSGLCHKSEIADDKNADVAQAMKSYRNGDKVKAKITAIDTEANKISFGIKPSYFDAEDFGVKKGDEDDEAEGEGDATIDGQVDEDASMDGDEDASDAENGFLDLEAEDDDEEDEEEDGEEDDEEEDEEDEDEVEVEEDGGEAESESDEEDVIMLGGDNDKPAQNGKPKSSTTASTALPIKGGFSWNGATPQQDEEEDSESSSDEESEDEAEDSAKAGKKRKGGHQPVKDLTGEIRTKQPESTAEFERALLASPNSSFLWIQFMSFQLALSEIDKAKDIGRRALTTIAFREEEEKLNVWMALINLENAHGTPESFDKLFKEAAQYNDAKTVYLRTASVLQQTEKLDAATEIFKKACKKFGQHSEPWTTFAEFEFVARDNADAARALLPRSLKSLPTSEHSQTIEQFAILEFRHGDQERGKTIFEGLVDRYPKRLDLWNVYIDQVTKLGDIQAARGLIDRALDQKLTPKKAKFLFKKLIFVEDRIGDEAGKTRAKTKAREWVLSQAKEDGDE